MGPVSSSSSVDPTLLTQADVPYSSVSAVDNPIRVFYVKIAVLAVAPFLIIAISYLVWNVIFMIEGLLKRRVNALPGGSGGSVAVKISH